MSNASLAWFKDVTELKDKPFNLFSGALLCEASLAVPSAPVCQPRARLLDSPSSFWFLVGTPGITCPAILWILPLKVPFLMIPSPKVFCESLNVFIF